MWAYLMKKDDGRCMRLAMEVGTELGLHNEETVQLAMAIHACIQDFMDARQSDHSDAD